MGTIQLWTSILKFVPLLFIATVGLFFIDTDNFAVWNLSGQGLWQAIGGAMALCLFSYIGVESASVAAAKVRDPQRNVPRATILGTLMAAGVYLLSLVAVFGIIPNAELQATTAPFATAAEAMFGVSWAGSLMALVVVISGFGALNGWTMLAGEMPYAAAADGLFPEHFARVSRRGVPAFGIVVSAILATAAVLLSHLGAAGITVFNTLVLMTGITGAIPYAFSAMAQIKWRIADGRAITRAGWSATSASPGSPWSSRCCSSSTPRTAMPRAWPGTSRSCSPWARTSWACRCTGTTARRMTQPGPMPPPVEARP